jgi:hypothetical protein
LYRLGSLWSIPISISYLTFFSVQSLQCECVRDHPRRIGVEPKENILF